VDGAAGSGPNCAQDRKEPDLCAEVLGIGRYFQQRFRDGTKQQVV
jgi:hypothetical protein